MDLVWSRKQELKNSTTFQDAYITQDYARAIQKECRTLIKAMKKARDLSFERKVIDRHLIVGKDNLPVEQFLNTNLKVPWRSKLPRRYIEPLGTVALIL